MKILDYLISIKNLDLNKLLLNWKWLTENKTIIAITKNGDALLIDTLDNLYFLDLSCGSIELISKNSSFFFENKISENKLEEILLSNVIQKLEKDGKILNKEQVFSYTILPILGGSYGKENRLILDVYEHFELLGELHYKLKDLPDGSNVRINVKL
jgi:hypothetical protein